MLSRLGSLRNALRPSMQRGMATKTLPPLRVAVTGAAGAIGYALVMRIASGEMLGKDQPVILQLLEIPGEGLKRLTGVEMELDDSAFPLVKGVIPTSDPLVAFGDADYALLVGARPRGPGMERKDLLTANAKIFQTQGNALNEVARRSCMTLVVGNPANTNALVAAHNAPDLDPMQFMAMTKLDQNRAEGMLAEKYGCGVDEIDRVIIWGNHSATQYPDISHASIKGKWAKNVVDMKWYERDFIPRVQKRGAEIITARGASSAASAASAAIDHLNCVHCGSGEKWQSMGVLSKGDYGIEKGIYYSVPAICTGDQSYNPVMGIPIDAYSANKMNITEKELLEERDGVKDLLGPFDKIVKTVSVRSLAKGAKTDRSLSSIATVMGSASEEFNVKEKMRRRLVENAKSSKPDRELNVVNAVLAEAGLPPYTAEIYEKLQGPPPMRKQAMELYAELKLKKENASAKDKEKMISMIKAKKAYEF